MLALGGLGFQLFKSCYTGSKGTKREHRVSAYNGVKEKLSVILVKDHKIAIKFRIASTILKFATLVLYIVQVAMDTQPYVLPEHLGDFNSNRTYEKTDIIWNNILYVSRPASIRYAQIGIAFYSIFESIVYLYLDSSRKLLSKIISIYFIIEIICSVPWIFELAIPSACGLFVPMFLNCWLVRRNIDFIFKDYNMIQYKEDDTTIWQYFVSLISLVFSVIFTFMCGFQHLQRAIIGRGISLVEAFYFSIITISSVGYGDITAAYWLPQMYVTFMLIIAIITLPAKIESMASLWSEQKKTGGEYTGQKFQHIVLCVTHVNYDFIQNFLKEFYGHRRHQNLQTVILTTAECSTRLSQLLNAPLWHGRLNYLIGSALQRSDLKRAKVDQAYGVFIISARGFIDKNTSDQHTILRSWAIKDYAPDVPQYVQLYRTENKVHLEFVEHLVCEDEFKYAILANNCICPGISTLLTILINKTSSRIEDDNLEKWQDLYGKLASNQIQAVVARESNYFHDYVGKQFTTASLAVHENYSVCLVGIGTKDKRFRKPGSYINGDELSESVGALDSSFVISDEAIDTLSLTLDYNVVINPGTDYIIQPTDVCLYIAITKDQDFQKTLQKPNLVNALKISPKDVEIDRELCRSTQEFLNYQNSVMEERRSVNENRNSISKSPKRSLHLMNNLSVDVDNESGLKTTNRIDDIIESDIVVDVPFGPLGFSQNKCKLLRVPRNICCLEYNGVCAHRDDSKQVEYKWTNKCIIVDAEHATSELVNFILPLRSKARSTAHMKPIILLLANEPSTEFLESICCFPLIYWMKGDISNTMDVLRASILDSHALVVVTFEQTKELDDETLYDSQTILGVQNITKLFPATNIIAEINHASNIRFMKQRNKTMEKENDSRATYMYRTPFTTGHVFSASMVDTLLYQAFGRPFLIDFTRLLIGIDTVDGSGTLTSIGLTSNDTWIKTYGDLYKKLATSTGEIPIGIYRTLQAVKPNEVARKEVQDLVLLNIHKLNMKSEKYDKNKQANTKTAYVLINPSMNLELEPDDKIYLLKPGNSEY